MFSGSCCALITPFRDGQVDERAFREFIEWQIAQGTQALIPCGTTGESPTLSHEEHRRVTEIAIATTGGRVPVIAGAGSNSTEEAIGLTQHAAHAGADAALVVVPYYNKPSQEGIYQHFKAVHDAADIPIIIYNIPGRTVVEMTSETLGRLAKLPRIVGMKDSTKDPVRPHATREVAGDDFAQLSGEDGTVLPFLAMGGHGCISVSANVAPAQLAEMHAAWQRGDVATAQAINARLMALHDAMFCEPSPAPAKYGASLLGLCSADVRLPIVPCGDAAKAQIRQAMQHAGLIA
ncbi:4-hydroxy-tetrahydrodipicolinate synthase [Limimonas halophila]